MPTTRHRATRRHPKSTARPRVARRQSPTPHPSSTGTLTRAQAANYDYIMGGQNVGAPASTAPSKRATAARTKQLKTPGIVRSGVHETFVWVSAGPMLPNTWYYVPISEAGMYTSMGGVVAGRRSSSHSSSSHTSTSRTHRIPIPNPGTTSHVSQHPAPPHLQLPAATRSPHV